ncbi:MAG TPA: glycosyltransferase family 4 protein [Cyclobacteriaceae bacterium]|nr:glycosyltransferase family 4 protein [Cyclobacteriaceae bacterium]
MKRVAIIVPGGFGTGKDNLGIPALEQVVKRLSKEFGISVFQLYRVNEDYQPENFKLFGFRKTNKVVQYLRLFRCFRREHYKEKFDVVHGFWAWPCGFCAVLFGKIFKIKSVVSVQGGDGSSVRSINYGYLDLFFYRQVILWSLHEAAEATVLTRFLSDNLKKAGLKRDPRIVPFGVDNELFSYREKSLAPCIQFIHVGNFNSVKDQGTLLRAFAMIKKSIQCRLTMIGEGNNELNILKLVKELDVHEDVTVLHHMSYSKLPKQYQASDILLHTSLSEGQGVVIAEAMSCGLLVCGTNVGLLYDLPDACISVEVKDHVGLATKILALINDQAQMNSLRTNAKNWAVTHDVHWTVSEFGKLYY